MDACPNWSPFTELPTAALKFDQDQSRILKTSGERRNNIRTTLVPARFQMRTDFRSTERLARQERNLEFRRFRTRNQDRSFRRSSDPAIRFSSPMDDDLTNQRLRYKRSTDMERRGDSNRNRRTNERTNEPSQERRFLTLTRSMERVAKERNNLRQDERSPRNVEARSRMRSMVRRDSRLDQDRSRSFARSEEREFVNERRDNSLRSSKRSTIYDDSGRRERANRLYLVREKRESQSQSQLDGTSEAPTANSEESRGRLTNRRSNRRRSVSRSRRASERSSVSLESRNREEIRAERRSKERRSDRRVVEERFNHRSTEQKLDRRLSEQRSERRSTEQTTTDRRLIEQRSDRRLSEQKSDRRRVEQRFDRRRVEQRFNHRSTEQRADRRLPEQRTDRRNVEQIEQRFNHRSTEQRSDRRLPEQRSDRRLMEQRFNQRSTESGFDRRLAEKKLDRRLAEHRSDRRHRFPEHGFDRRRNAEQRFNQRSMEHRFDRRFILQRYDDLNRARTRSMPQHSQRFSQKEDRLTDNDDSQSYSIQRTTPSDDSAAFRSHARSSRVQLRSSHSINNRFLESREKLFNRNNDILSRTNLFAASDILKEKNSMKYALTFEIIRQALVVALCIMYSLSLFRGKRSIVR